MNGHKFIGRKFTCLLSLAFSFNPTCLVAKAKWRGESAGKDWCSTSVLDTTYRYPLMHASSVFILISLLQTRYRISPGVYTLHSNPITLST